MEGRPVLWDPQKALEVNRRSPLGRSMPRITAILGLLADVSSGQKNLFTLYLLMYIFSRAFSNAVSDKLFVGESLNSTTISNLTANVCFYMERVDWVGWEKGPCKDGWDLQPSRIVQTMANICSQIINWVFEFELVSYDSCDSAVKRRFNTCVSLTLNYVSVWSGRVRGTTALESELAWEKPKISRRTN